jgi:hypothetical protein
MGVLVGVYRKKTALCSSLKIRFLRIMLEQKMEVTHGIYRRGIHLAFASEAQG